MPAAFGPNWRPLHPDRSGCRVWKWDSPAGLVTVNGDFVGPTVWLGRSVAWKDPTLPPGGRNRSATDAEMRRAMKWAEREYGQWSDYQI